MIRVERGWDPTKGAIELKTNAGRRRVPIAAVLRDHLLEHRLAPGAKAMARLRQHRERRRSRQRSSAEPTRHGKAGLERITLHECRHTFASLMIAAGVNAKALSTYMGHANIAITLDRYGHLMPGYEDEAAGLLDTYLERANTGRASGASECLTGPLTVSQGTESRSWKRKVRT